MVHYIVNSIDFYEEKHWTLDCPNCNQIIETFDDPDYEENIQCPYCNKLIIIE